jgi:hypothetical protein
MAIMDLFFPPRPVVRPADAKPNGKAPATATAAAAPRK